MIQEILMIPKPLDGLKVIWNESMDKNDPEDFDETHVFNEPKGISLEVWISFQTNFLQMSFCFCADSCCESVVLKNPKLYEVKIIAMVDFTT